VSTPSPEANNNDAIAVLSDTPIAEALRQAREKAGLSVSMMARSAQTSRAAIHAYETGTRRALMSSAVTELARADYAAAILWVLDANDRARRFYALAGWAEDGASPSRTCPTTPIPST
jgi:DNA-binding XRE family transcriptional regulator